MSDVHRCLLDTLYCLDDICRKNDIEYFLEGGSLLGAVRYGDIIPWDDDIDVEMTRENFEKLMALPASEFPEGFEVLDPQGKDERHVFLPQFVNRNHKVLMHKIKDHEEEEFGDVTLDIFVLDETRNKVTHMAQSLLFIYMQLVDENYVNYRDKVHLHDKYQPVYKVLKGLAKVSSIFLKPDHIIKLHRFFSKMYNGKNCKYYFPSDSMMVFQIFDKDWYSERVTVKLKDKEIYTMKGYKNYLEFEYGKDYLTPPPVDERVTQHCDIELDIPIQ